MIPMLVDTAVIVPINIMPLVDSSDFVSIESAIAFDAAGLVLVWNFVTPAGVVTQTPVTPTESAGVYDWQNKGNGMYAIEMPASGGASINNDTEGVGYFTGVATGVLPWRGPNVVFGKANVINSLVLGSDLLDIDLTAAVANKVSDYVLRRNMDDVEGSSDGGALSTSSLYGFVQQAQNSDTTTNEGFITVFRTDDVELGQIAITSNEDAEHITGVG